MKWLYLLLACLVSGCYDEGTLTPTEEPELIYGKYTLPQGDHDYDDVILDFYEKYNSLILYKFTNKDFGWNVVGDVSWDPVRDTSLSIGTKYEAIPADELYVGKQIELLERKFLKYLPEDWKKNLLPQRILLCSVLDKVQVLNGVVASRDFLYMYPGYHHIAINWGNEEILTMTAEERNMFKISVCETFFKNLYSEGSSVLKSSDSFFGAGSYSEEITQDKIYEHGILNYEHRAKPMEDWCDYIVTIISNPLSRLEAAGGILSAEIDTKNVIREKYDIMIDFFKTEYSVDLQAIGDDVE